MEASSSSPKKGSKSNVANYRPISLNKWPMAVLVTQGIKFKKNDRKNRLALHKILSSKGLIIMKMDTKCIKKSPKFCLLLKHDKNDM